MSKEPASASGLRQLWMPSNFDAFARDMRALAGASPAVSLARLRELDAAAADDDMDGRSLDAQRLRLMFSVLYHLEGKPLAPRASLPDKVNSILALYESKASASYLAGLHPSKRICHLSDKPLPLDALPNVQPLVVPSVSPAAFSIPPQLFEAVYALSLPALCSASDLRAIVHNVATCLKPGGTLFLVLIDPLLCADTLGRRLRRWLDLHLVDKLVKQSRCPRPTVLLPQWLGQEGLRGPGSTLTTAKFYAVPESVGRLARDPDPAIERANVERSPSKMSEPAATTAAAPSP